MATMLLPAIMAVAAAEGGKTQVRNFPLAYQIAFVVFAALFLWAFTIARDPRGWRRLYQAKFERHEEFSVNRNKRLDEVIKKRCIPIAMIFLTAAVGAFILGITHRHRHTPQTPMTQEDKFRAADTRRILETPKDLGR
jgi:hypothetical protein